MKYKTKHNRDTSKPVDMYTKEGVFVKSFESIHAAAQYHLGSKGNIKKVLEGKANTAYNHKWVYRRKDNNE